MGVEVQRMEGCQCCRPRTYFVNPGAQFSYLFTHVVYVLHIILHIILYGLELASIDSISGSGAYFTGRHMGNFFAACVNAAFGHRRAALDGQSFVVHLRITGLDAAVAAEINIFCQFQIQFAIFGNDTDIIGCCHFCRAAGNLQCFT